MKETPELHTLTQMTRAELDAGLENILQSPKNEGKLELIVQRPSTCERKTLTEAELNQEEGLVGDNWLTRRRSNKPDQLPDPDRQLNIMNSRVVALVAQTKDRWQWAGDQLYLDLDLSTENLPLGSKFALGSAVIEVTAPEHTGCKKFVERYGIDAMKFVNSNRELHLRGICAKVVTPGTIRVGDVAKKL